MAEVIATGSERTRLIVLRGNSGSGKSSIARAVRDRYGRGCALVEQDYLRRILLRERDVAAEDMRGWYRAQDLLGVEREHVITENSTFEASVELVLSHITAHVRVPPTR